MRGDEGAEAEYSAARSRSAALTQSGWNPSSLGVRHTGRVSPAQKLARARFKARGLRPAYGEHCLLGHPIPEDSRMAIPRGVAF
jgi:hypothetical protein